MDLFLLENHTESLFNRIQCESRGCSLSVAQKYFLLTDEKRLHSGTAGAVSNKRFPWKLIDDANDSLEGQRVFKIKLSFTTTKSLNSQKYDIQIDGDLSQLLKYVYPSDHVPQILKLKLSTSITAAYSRSLKITHEILSTTGSTGDSAKFFVSSELNHAFANAITRAQAIKFERLTIQLIGINEMSTATSTDACCSIQRVVDKLINDQILCDFILVAANGIEMPCHKNFLAAHSLVFHRMFQMDFLENQHGKCQLGLSEKCLHAFLDFIYCFKMKTPTENSCVAVELLEISYEKQIVELETATKELILKKEDDWLDLDSALRLFVLCLKVEGLENLKQKAVKAIKLKKDEMDSSELYLHLIRNNTEFAKQFIKCVVTF